MNKNLFLELSLLALLLAASVAAFFGEYEVWLKFSLYVCTAGALILFIYWYGVKTQKLFPKKAAINHLLLVNDSGEVQKNWHIQGEQSLILGKSYKSQSVDIDLSETEYAVLVAKEHALMNLVDGEWYLEDLGSRNGTGVKSEHAQTIYKLKDKPYKLKKNDWIYIAKTKLIVQ
ncbi:FHA domain-containing protein [Enterococcus sp. CWB-B31]|uniref:FHA domain-containing protein n=1 Tax=Enterococcus sp. CWB-B31 TaxID=2885159 RepID=UPI001E5CBA66|nr:FHA domain-containing protein [Enterococcus sp. CWB-B31]MCB5954232.1 FHA domain-containing protein [Enterococcus sp. CWB-B31]